MRSIVGLLGLDLPIPDTRRSAGAVGELTVLPQRIERGTVNLTDRGRNEAGDRSQTS